MQQVGNRSSCIVNTSNMAASSSNVMLVGMNELGFDCGYRGTSKEKNRITSDVNYQYGERRGR